MPATIHKSQLEHESPIAGVINKSHIRENRSLSYTEVRLHVSDLMKTDSQWGFCARQHVIQKLFAPKILSASLPASFDLLFALGNALHDNARNRWINNDTHGAKRVLARWHCPCKETWHVGVNPALANDCKRCRFPVNIFDEYEIHDKELCIIAHPDFNIVRGKDVIETGAFNKAKHLVRIVEIKGIDRIDVNWKTLDAPLGEHSLQGTMYYHIMKRAGYRVDRKISYVYGERSLKETLFNGKCWKEFEQDAWPIERVEPFFTKARLVIKSVKDNYVPPRTVCKTVDCGRANNCPVAHLCFEIDKNGYQKAKAPKRIKGKTVKRPAAPKF